MSWGQFSPHGMLKKDHSRDLESQAIDFAGKFLSLFGGPPFTMALMHLFAFIARIKDSPITGMAKGCIISDARS